MIRKATPCDFVQILALYKAGLDEIGEDWKESFLVRKIVTSYKLAPSFVLEIDGKIQGFAGFTIVTASHNGQKVMAEYMFYIRPEFRGDKSLLSLVQAAQDFAKENDFPLRVEFIINNDEQLKRRWRS